MAYEQQSLDGILNDDAPPPPAEEPEKKEPETKEPAAKEPAAKAERERAEDGKFKAKEEAPAEKPKAEVAPEAKAEPAAKAAPQKQELDPQVKAFLAAAQDERRKRQDLERQLAEIRQQLPKREEEAKKTFWDDPEGHFKSVEQRIQQREVALTLKVSEQIARSKYQDFDANIEVFGEILRTPAGPGIHAQWLASQDPAEFAYRMGKQTKELREVGNIDALREKIEKETRTRLEAEYKQKQEDLEKKREAIPPSLSDVRGGAKPSQPVWSGPTPLGDILSKK